MIMTAINIIIIIILYLAHLHMIMTAINIIIILSLAHLLWLPSLSLLYPWHIFYHECQEHHAPFQSSRNVWW